MPRRTNPKLPSPRDADIFRRVVLRGERMTVVARDYGLSKQRVHAICERSRRMAFEELAEDFSEHRRQTLLRLEHVYGEAMEAWERSKAGRHSETETTTGLGVPVRSTSRQVASGDVRFLTEARQAMADIRELCGLDPTKAEVLEVRTSKTVEVEVDLEKLSMDELERLSQLAKLRRLGLIRLVDEEAGGNLIEVSTGPRLQSAVAGEARNEVAETSGVGCSRNFPDYSHQENFRFQTN